MPKQRASTRRRRRNTNDTNALIRHHLEEAAVHLGAVKQLVAEHPKHPQPHKDAITKALGEAGKRIKKLYTLHGGHPDA